LAVRTGEPKYIRQPIRVAEMMKGDSDVALFI